MSNESSHLQRLKTHLSSRRETLMSLWRERVLVDRQVESANYLSRTEFRDHVPFILEILEDRLVCPTESGGEAQDSFISIQRDIAGKHGDHRWHQGYTVEEIMREWNHLHLVVLAEIEEFCAQNFEYEQRHTGIRARQVWAEIVSEGLTRSATQYDKLQKARAQGNVRDLEATLEKTRLFEQERGTLLRQATHDLRGSLSVVRGATSLLDWQQIETLEDSERRHVLRILTNSVQSLWEMMNEMLDLARLEAGVEEFVLGTFDVGATMSELGESTQTLADEKRLTLNVAGPGALRVQGDAVKTRRIAQNLLLNALKYTQTGYVELRWNELTEQRWQMEVIDSGPGISQSSIAPLLGAMKNGSSIEVEEDVAPNVDSQRGMGEGVGLSIVKRLCELCGATLQLDTGHNGSCFRVIFPKTYN